MVADHISRILVEHNTDIIKDRFPYEQLFAISSNNPPWFAHIVNYLTVGQVPSHWSTAREKSIFLTSQVLFLGGTRVV